MMLSRKVMSVLYNYSSATISPPSSLANSYARYDPSKGYYWEFPDDKPAGGHMDTASGVLLTLFVSSLPPSLPLSF